MAEKKKQLLNDEELDMVTGGSQEQCEEFYQIFGTYKTDYIANLAAMAFGVNRDDVNIEYHNLSTGTFFYESAQSNKYYINGKEISHADFKTTLVNYCKTHSIPCKF